LQLTTGGLLLLLCSPVFLFSQEINQRESFQLGDKQIESPAPLQQSFEEGIDVNFLFSYYDQDGQHSAVTGGLGTERLKDYASKIIVNISLDRLSKLTATLGINYYTSASTDNINNNVSSASKDDYRGQLSLAFTKTTPDKKQTFGFSAGGSSETDYISTWLGTNWSKESKDGNREVGVSAQAFFDTWLLIFPDELRQSGNELVSTDKRRTYYLGLTYSQVLTKRLHALFTTELILQRGLLSTPFHRAFFGNASTPKVERLPEHRLKIPLGLRLHYFLGDYIVLRFFYRYYFDSFGIHANSLSLETPLKISNYFSIYPFYRFHTQTRADHFLEFGKHELGAKYYTSDYDLSAFHSRKIGFGISYSPLYGIGGFGMPFSKKITMFKSLDLRYANYYREDGLRAFSISANLAFTTF